jgi:thioredoxin-related protein
LAPKIEVRAVPAVFLLALSILVTGVVLAGEADTRDAREYFFEQTFGDLPEEMQAAGEQGKIGMLLFFEAEDCPYCQYMLRKIFNQKHVQDWYRERFVNIAVDIHGDVELKDFDGITLPSKVFSDHRRIFLTPVVSFLDLNGVEIYRHLGMTKTPEDFLLLGEYIEGEHYFDTEFKVFAKARGLKAVDILITPAADTE